MNLFSISNKRASPIYISFSCVIRIAHILLYRTFLSHLHYTHNQYTFPYVWYYWYSRTFGVISKGFIRRCCRRILCWFSTISVRHVHFPPKWQLFSLLSSENFLKVRYRRFLSFFPLSWNVRTPSLYTCIHTLTFPDHKRKAIAFKSTTKLDCHLLRNASLRQRMRVACQLCGGKERLVLRAGSDKEFVPIKADFLPFDDPPLAATLPTRPQVSPFVYTHTHTYKLTHSTYFSSFSRHLNAYITQKSPIFCHFSSPISCLIVSPVLLREAERG